jgi:hypothetical protein
LYPPGQWREVEDRLKTFDASVVLQYVAGTARVYLLQYPATARR